MSEHSLKTTIVVSDKFEKFAENQGVMTFSHFRSLLRSGCVDTQVVVIGQGINSDLVEQLKQDVRDYDYGSSVHFVTPSKRKLNSLIVHKSREENVAISLPEKSGKNQYSASLTVDECCDEMRDHVTGQHVQGTLLIEAARQMMMASVELDTFSPENRGAYSYILNRLEVSYFRYLFPVDATIKCRIADLTIDDKGSLATELFVEIFQHDERVCSVACHATGMPKHKLEILESRSAKKSARHEINAWKDQCLSLAGVPA